MLLRGGRSGSNSDAVNTWGVEDKNVSLQTDSQADVSVKML